MSSENPSPQNGLPEAKLPVMADTSPRMLNKVNGHLPHAQAIYGSAMPPALSSGPNVFSLLKALRRRWLLAGTLGLLVGAIAAGATWWFLPQPKFMAVRRVRVLSSPDYLLNRDVERSASGDTFQRVQMAYVTDRLVLNKALNNVTKKGAKSQEGPLTLEWVESHLKVEFTSPELMQVSISGDQPTELVQLVDEIVNAYLDEFANERSTDLHKRLEVLHDVRNKAEKKCNE